MKLVPSLTLLAALSLPTSALASPGQAPPPSTAKSDDDAAARKARGEARFLEALRRAGVEEARQKRALEIHRRFVTERDAAHEAGRPHHDSLRKLLEEKSRDEAAYARALAGVRAARDRVDAARKKQEAELGQLLKASEQAHLLGARAGGPRKHRGHKEGGRHGRRGSRGARG